MIAHNKKVQLPSINSLLNQPPSSYTESPRSHSQSPPMMPQPNYYQQHNESSRNYTHQQQHLYPQHHHQQLPQHHHQQQQYIQHQHGQYGLYSQPPHLHHPQAPTAHYEPSTIAYPYYPQQQPPQPLPAQPLTQQQPPPSSSCHPHSPAASPPDSRGVKPKRKRATADQINRLNQVFEQTFFPTSDQRLDLAQELGMTPRTVQIWFQNKRQGWRSEHRRPVPREPLDEYNRM